MITANWQLRQSEPHKGKVTKDSGPSTQPGKQPRPAEVLTEGYKNLVPEVEEAED